MFTLIGIYSLKLPVFFKTKLVKKNITCQKPVAHACNPSYSGGKDKEDHG
jgi:hypothetical protein